MRAPNYSAPSEMMPLHSFSSLFRFTEAIRPRQGEPTETNKASNGPEVPSRPLVAPTAEARKLEHERPPSPRAREEENSA